MPFIQLTPEGLAAIILSILGTVGYVMRSNARTRTKITNAEIASQEREAKLRNELMRDARESQLKLEKYQESARAAALEERNATILEQHKLNDRLITTQDLMLKLQTGLREAEQKEREAKARAQILLDELTRNKEALDNIQRKLTAVESQLGEANLRITALQKENEELKAEIGKIKKSSTQPLEPVKVSGLPSVT